MKADSERAGSMIKTASKVAGVKGDSKNSGEKHTTVLIMRTLLFVVSALAHSVKLFVAMIKRKKSDQTTSQEERAILAHNFRGFNPQSPSVVYSRPGVRQKCHGNRNVARLLPSW